MGFVTGVVVPIVVAIIAAVGGLFYIDIKAYLFPDKFSGNWLLVGKEIGDKPNEYRQFEEQLTLSSSGGVVSGKGRSGEFERDYKGFAKGEHIFLSYSTPGGQGIGVLVLDEQRGLGKEFTGTWKGKDCTVKRIVECPVILIKGHSGSSEVTEVRKRYSSLLDGTCRDGSPSQCP